MRSRGDNPGTWPGAQLSCREVVGQTGRARWAQTQSRERPTSAYGPEAAAGGAESGEPQILDRRDVRRRVACRAHPRFCESSDRRIGEPDGSSTGISVELVDATDFLSKSRMQSSSDPSPAGPGDVVSPPPRPAEAPSPPRAAEPQTTAAPPIEVEKPSPLSPPAPTKKESAPAAKPKPKPVAGAKSTAAVRFSRRDDRSKRTVPRRCAASRPHANRSRSRRFWAQASFAPCGRRCPPRAARLGRVTIRLFLSETGNLADLRLIRSGGRPDLDQNVMFCGPSNPASRSRPPARRSATAPSWSPTSTTETGASQELAFSLPQSRAVCGPLGPAAGS